jgi:hypothetical protein
VFGVMGQQGNNGTSTFFYVFRAQALKACLFMFLLLSFLKS